MLVIVERVEALGLMGRTSSWHFIPRTKTSSWHLIPRTKTSEIYLGARLQGNTQNSYHFNLYPLCVLYSWSWPWEGGACLSAPSLLAPELPFVTPGQVVIQILCPMAQGFVEARDGGNSVHLSHGCLLPTQSHSLWRLPQQRSSQSSGSQARQRKSEEARELCLMGESKNHPLLPWIIIKI